jgi:hypothetical protein
VARGFLTQEARLNFDELPVDLQDPVEKALTDIEDDHHAAGMQLFGRLKASGRLEFNYRTVYTIEGSRRSPESSSER